MHDNDDDDGDHLVSDENTIRLVPVLVACTVYSQDQIAEFEALPKVDEDIPDAPEDIRPMFHRSKNGGECLGFS